MRSIDPLWSFPTEICVLCLLQLQWRMLLGFAQVWSQTSSKLLGAEKNRATFCLEVIIFYFLVSKKLFFFFKFWNKFNSVQISPIDFQEISQTCATTLFCPWSLLLGKAGPLIPDLRAGGIPMNSSLFLGSPGRVFPAEGIRPSELVNREDTVGLPHLILPELTGKNCCCDPFLLYLRETSLCRYLFLTAIPVSEYIFRHSVHNH